MGNIAFDETEALKELHAMSYEARGLIAHHLNNSLMAVIGCIDLAQMKMRPGQDDSLGYMVSAREAAMHIMEDLRRFGCDGEPRGKPI
jgi:hypothetical protein